MQTATVTGSRNGLGELLQAAKARHGTLTLDRDAPVGEKLKALPKPRVKAGCSAVAAVLAERAEGR